MFDTDKLIQCVQEHPALWEKASKDYSDRNLKDKSWDTVGERLFDTWEEMIPAEKQQEVKDLKNRWRNIRDCYSKFINQGKSGDPAPKRRKYVYADSLGFLLQTLEKRMTTGNIEKDEEEDQSSLLDVEETSIETTSTATTSSASSKQSSTRSRPAARKIKSADMTAFQLKLLDKLDTSETTDNDGNKSFLLSMLPAMNKLTADQLLDFRFHVLQFFRDLKNERAQMPQTNPPPQIAHLQHQYNAHYGNPSHFHQYSQHAPHPVPYPTPSPILSQHSSIMSEDSNHSGTGDLFQL